MEKSNVLEHEFVEGIPFIPEETLRDYLTFILRRAAEDKRMGTEINIAVYNGMKIAAGEIVIPRSIQKVEKREDGEILVNLPALIESLSGWITDKGDDTPAFRLLEIIPETELHGMRVIESFLSIQLEKIQIEQLTSPDGF